MRANLARTAPTPPRSIAMDERTELDAAKAEIQAADDRRVKALLDRDYGALAELISDSLVYHHASGRVDGKESYLAQFASGTLWFVAINRRDTAIDIVGGTAICRGVAENEVSVDGV